MDIRQRNKTLNEINKNLTQNDYEELIFLVKEKFGYGELERMKNPLDLFIAICKKHESEVEAVQYIIKILKDIERPKLAKKLEPYVAVSSQLRHKIEDPAEHFVPRSYLTLPILNKISSSKKMHQIFMMVGMNSGGKSELLKQLCRELEERYFVIPLIESTTEGDCSKLMENICFCLSNTCQSNNNQDHQRCALTCLEKLTKPFILPMDISNVPHKISFCSDLKSFLVKLQANQHCKAVIITAASNCTNCKINEKNLIQVPHLDEKESAKLLENLRVSWTQETKKSVLKFCRGCPTLLVHFAASPNCYKSIKRESGLVSLHCFQVDNAFKEQFHGLSQELRTSLIKLCIIRDDFSPVMAAAVLGDQLEEAIFICDMLVQHQLLFKREDAYYMQKLTQHYIMKIAENDSHVKPEFLKAQISIIKLFIRLLSLINHKFMGYDVNDKFLQSISQDAKSLFSALMKEQKNDCSCRKPSRSSCECPMVRRLLMLYRKYQVTFFWALKAGIRNDSLNLWKLAVDCANECVSFLPKAMVKETIVNVYETIQKSGMLADDQGRKACTNVSIAFLKMYHNGCKEDAKSNIALLKEATEILTDTSLDRKDFHLHFKEVIAHAHSKLGHLIAANHEDEFEIGLNTIEKAIEIRKSEVRKERGSRAMIAAGYVDIANIYKHVGKLQHAISHGEVGLALYRVTFDYHPFTASTMSFLGEMFQSNEEHITSSTYFLHARKLADDLLGNHLDTARFYRGHADAYASNGDKEIAKKLYFEAHKKGRQYFGEKEHLQIKDKYLVLCEKKEGKCLQEEAMEMKRLCSVDWETHEAPYVNTPRKKKSIAHIAKKYTFGWVKCSKCEFFLIFLIIFLLSFVFFLYFKEVSIRDCTCYTPYPFHCT